MKEQSVLSTIYENICRATGKAAESIARQPESASNIRSTLLIGLVLSESTAIYGFVIAILLIIMK